MGKTVQNAFARAETLDCQTVVFLVEEKAGFLPVLDIHQIADTIFNDLYFCIKWFPDKALIALHALL